MYRVSTFTQALIRCFLVGLLAVLPLVITVAVVVWIAGHVTNMLGPHTVLGRMLARLGVTFSGGETSTAYAVGWIVVLVVIFSVGVVIEFRAGQFLYQRLDAFATRIPVLGGVYGTARQVAAMLDKQDKADIKGMSVVFCVFGEESGAAFLALLPTQQVFQIGDVDYHAVLVPTAPVPVGGSLIFVPARSIRPANVTVDAFMSIYVSMGVSGPQFLATRPAGTTRI